MFCNQVSKRTHPNNFNRFCTKSDDRTLPSRKHEFLQKAVALLIGLSCRHALPIIMTAVRYHTNKPVPSLSALECPFLPLALKTNHLPTCHMHHSYCLQGMRLLKTNAKTDFQSHECVCDLYPATSALESSRMLKRKLREETRCDNDSNSCNMQSSLHRDIFDCSILINELGVDFPLIRWNEDVEPFRKRSRIENTMGSLSVNNGFRPPCSRMIRSRRIDSGLNLLDKEK